MAHVQPVSEQALGPLAPALAAVEAAMGFVPNSMKTMAHMPQLTVAFTLLSSTVFGADLKNLTQALAEVVPDQQDVEDNLAPGLVQLIAYACSLSAGCRYCQAHTSHSGHRRGEDEEKFAQMLRYETHPAFTDAERACIGLALAAGAVPNETEATHFAQLRKHYNERQLVQIVAVISLFGFLNRWNDTMATQLETMPTAFAQQHLSAAGWQASKHAPAAHDGNS